MGIDYDQIRRLISLLEKNKLTELAVEEADFAVVIKAEQDEKKAIAPAQVAQSSVNVEVQPLEALEEVIEEVEEEMPEELPSENIYEVKSPMIGVYYERPSPDSPPFIAVGDIIESGQTIGLIEAMKVFSEVPSDVEGKVVAIPVESGKLVQEGDVLVAIDTSEG